LAGGILNRLNVSLFGLWSHTGPIFISSLMEIEVTAALFTFDAAVFAMLVKLLPVFPAERELEAMPTEGYIFGGPPKVFTAPRPAAKG
jgi:hypothetical protein